MHRVFQGFFSLVFVVFSQQQLTNLKFLLWNRFPYLLGWMGGQGEENFGGFFGFGGGCVKVKKKLVFYGFWVGKGWKKSKKMLVFGRVARCFKTKTHG